MLRLLPLFFASPPTKAALRLGYNLRARATEFWVRFVLPVLFCAVVLVAVMVFGVQQLQACVASKTDWGVCIKDLTGVPQPPFDDPKPNNSTCPGILTVGSSAFANFTAAAQMVCKPLSNFTSMNVSCGTTPCVITFSNCSLACGNSTAGEAPKNEFAVSFGTWGACGACW
jgi:hypothetical protein